MSVYLSHDRIFCHRIFMVKDEKEKGVKLFCKIFILHFFLFCEYVFTHLISPECRAI